MTTHTDKAYERDLKALRERLLAMGACVEAMIAECVLALAERDSKLAEHVMKCDVEVNQLELQIDDLCRKIIALRQPAASDLRLITTALKIVTDLERVGDLAVNIAERATDLNKAPASRFTVVDLTNPMRKVMLNEKLLGVSQVIREIPFNFL